MKKGSFVPAQGNPAPGLFQGYGVFETFALEGGKVFRLREHLERMSRGGHSLGLEAPSLRSIRSALSETLPQDADARVKLVLARENGEAALYLLLGTLLPPPEGGVSATVAGFSRNLSGPLAAIKSLSYAENVFARERAIEKGFYESIFLDSQGQLTEGAYSNLFWASKDTLFTPARGCLPGVTRKAVLDLCWERGIGVIEGDYRLDELLESDEAFLTNSLIGVLPLVRIGERDIGTGDVGNMTSALKGFFHNMKEGESEPVYLER